MSSLSLQDPVEGDEKRRGIRRVPERPGLLSIAFAPRHPILKHPPPRIPEDNLRLEKAPGGSRGATFVDASGLPIMPHARSGDRPAGTAGSGANDIGRRKKTKGNR
ncbi:MAG TPA: hypothetical protein P5551_03830 [Syntrophales bacterium]|nr:hypothetical protein [Syntrophales bacterium]